MVKRIEKYLRERGVVTEEDRVLIGVSGGVDSMTLLELFKRTVPAERLAVAHCNFSLRGEESNADQDLVARTCTEYGITLHTTRFDTEKEAEERGESIQMAARRLRYNWFEELCGEYGYTKVAIAHHADDSVETFFINLIRGTGLRGLTGISEQRERIIRPLLFAQRDEILAYATREGIDYREDRTNSSTKYLRNRIRHEIIPRLSTSGHIFAQTMEQNLTRLQEAQQFINLQIERLRSRAVSQDNTIDLSVLDRESLQFELYELLRPYGFASETSREIARAIETYEKQSSNSSKGATLSGKQFIAERWTATIDRERLLLTPSHREPFVEENISEDDPRLEWLTVDELPDSLVTFPNIAYLRADSLKFPLRLRQWNEGDWFIPLGMVGQKLVSDFLIDSKVPLTEKSRQGVLLSGDTIVWLVGRRIDDRYKVIQTATRIIRITL